MSRQGSALLAWSHRQYTKIALGRKRIRVIYSEDPLLSGTLAAAIIEGISSQNVVATPKHFVCNDQKHGRNAVNTIVTERALREMYLRPFQIIARVAPPAALMTAYNKVNGEHAFDSSRLLDDIVRKEWKWYPLIMSDWLMKSCSESCVREEY